MTYQAVAHSVFLSFWTWLYLILIICMVPPDLVYLPYWSSAMYISTRCTEDKSPQYGSQYWYTHGISIRQWNFLFSCGKCGHFLRIEDILVQKSHTYVAITDFCCNFDLFWSEYSYLRVEMRRNSLIWGFRSNKI
jgi:hypothetical protein